jgi:hypothetical protein
MTRDHNGVDIEYLNTLEAELDRAEILNSKRIPANVINHARVRRHLHECSETE